MFPIQYLSHNVPPLSGLVEILLGGPNQLQRNPIGITEITDFDTRADDPRRGIEVDPLGNEPYHTDYRSSQPEIQSD